MKFATVAVLAAVAVSDVDATCGKCLSKRSKTRSAKLKMVLLRPMISLLLLKSRTSVKLLEKRAWKLGAILKDSIHTHTKTISARRSTQKWIGNGVYARRLVKLLLSWWRELNLSRLQSPLLLLLSLPRSSETTIVQVWLIHLKGSHILNENELWLDL